MVKIALLGDISFNTDLAQKKPGSWKLFTGEIENHLNQADIIIFNLESPVTGSGPENQLKWPRLKTKEMAVDNLDFSGTTVAVLANNHAYDCLVDGYKNTVKALSSRNILSLGAGLSLEDAAKPVIIKKKGIAIGVLAYNAASTNPSVPPEADFYINELEEKKVIREIRCLKQKTDVLIVYCHWGVDYFEYPTPGQRAFAMKMADAGAKIVFGAHPHVIQGWEKYRGNFIFYSSGNTCFGNDEAIENGPKNRRSLTAFFRISTGKGLYLEKLCFMIRSIDGLNVSSLNGKKQESLKPLCWPLSLDKKAYYSFFKRKVLIDSLFFKPFNFFFGPDRNFPEQIKKIRPSHFKKLIYP